ncbi:hypothetical protein SAMN06265360_1373 [Haloechinothrix alba]|uniref:Uncharacterized protein n=1 Tax=Haloechinothrix alba TaxID=664784 RepID=A0A239AEP3_9PSEU|nr:hypothetical protein SAMN06265360_1373 [Haloechinothrix alba]
MTSTELDPAQPTGLAPPLEVIPEPARPARASLVRYLSPIGGPFGACAGLSDVTRPRARGPGGSPHAPRPGGRGGTSEASGPEGAALMK